VKRQVRELTGSDTIDGAFASLVASVAAVSAWVNGIFGPVRRQLERAFGIVRRTQQRVASYFGRDREPADVARTWDLDRHRRVSVRYLFQQLSRRYWWVGGIIVGLAMMGYVGATAPEILIALVLAPSVVATAVLMGVPWAIGVYYYVRSEYAHFGPDRTTAIHPTGYEFAAAGVSDPVTVTVWAALDESGDRAVAWEALETTGWTAHVQDGALVTHEGSLLRTDDASHNHLSVPDRVRDGLAEDWDALEHDGAGLTRFQFREAEERSDAWGDGGPDPDDYGAYIWYGLGGKFRWLKSLWYSDRDRLYLGGALVGSVWFGLSAVNLISVELPALAYSLLSMLVAFLIIQAMRYSYRHTTRLADHTALTPQQLQQRVHPFAWSLAVGPLAVAALVRTIAPTVAYVFVEWRLFGLDLMREIVATETGIALEATRKLRHAMLLGLETRIVDSPLLALAMTGLVAYAVLIWVGGMVASRPARDVSVSWTPVAVAAIVVLAAGVGAAGAAATLGTEFGPHRVGSVDGHYGDPTVSVAARGHQIVLTHEGGRPIVIPTLSVTLTLVEPEYELEEGTDIPSIMPQSVTHYSTSYGSNIAAFRESTPWVDNRLVYNVANETDYGRAMPAGTRVHVNFTAKWRLGAGQEQLSEQQQLVDKTVTLGEPCADGELPQYRVDRCATNLTSYMNRFSEGLKG
jgi:hypothetical protein